MTAPSSAVDRLRAAHQALTDRITAATKGPWIPTGRDVGTRSGRTVAVVTAYADEELIALAPLLAQGLADEAAELIEHVDGRPFSFHVREGGTERDCEEEGHVESCFRDGRISACGQEAPCNHGDDWLARWSGLLGALGQETT